jgi:hypothetical protein
MTIDTKGGGIPRASTSLIATNAELTTSEEYATGLVRWPS